MTCLVPLPPGTVGELKREHETGLGYQVVSVRLKDGRVFDQVVASEGCIIAVRGYAEVPFGANEIQDLGVNHRRWNFRRWRDTPPWKAGAASR